MKYVLFALAFYLLGAIPFSYLIARAKGVDVKRVGSGNVGATNVARSVGLPYGVLAFLLDWGKGVLSAWLALQWGLPVWLSAFAVAGHNWSPFLGFKSGKGVATTLGILAVLAWPVFLLTLAVWILLAVLTRYVSIASVIALLLVPIWLRALQAPSEGVWLMLGLGVLSAFQHRENFRRLVRGEEHRWGRRPPGVS